MVDPVEVLLDLGMSRLQVTKDNIAFLPCYIAAQQSVKTLDNIFCCIAQFLSTTSLDLPACEPIPSTPAIPVQDPRLAVQMPCLGSVEAVP